LRTRDHTVTRTEDSGTSQTQFDFVRGIAKCKGPSIIHSHAPQKPGTQSIYIADVDRYLLMASYVVGFKMAAATKFTMLKLGRGSIVTKMPHWSPDRSRRRLTLLRPEQRKKRTSSLSLISELPSIRAESLRKRVENRFRDFDGHSDIHRLLTA
jgi:hypothetical protein